MTNNYHQPSDEWSAQWPFTGMARDLGMLYSLGRDLAAVGVRYAEVTVTPVSHLALGIAPQALAAALTEGRRQVRAATPALREP